MVHRRDRFRSPGLPEPPCAVPGVRVGPFAAPQDADLDRIEFPRSTGEREVCPGPVTDGHVARSGGCGPRHQRAPEPVGPGTSQGLGFLRRTTGRSASLRMHWGGLSHKAIENILQNSLVHIFYHNVALYIQGNSC